MDPWLAVLTNEIGSDPSLAVLKHQQSSDDQGLTK
jgi:hypothetical protein